MGTTTLLQGLRVPESSDANQPWIDMGELAVDVERRLVMIFASAASRTAAFAAAGIAPAEGMLSWLQDVNRFEFHNGAAWIPWSLVPLVDQFQSATRSATSTTRVNVIASQSFSLPVATKVKISTGVERVNGTSGGELGRLIVNVDSVEQITVQTHTPVAGGPGEISGASPVRTLSLASGSHTVKVDMLRVSGGTEVNYTGTSLLVELGGP